MNTMSVNTLKDENNVPFYAWNCITLQLHNRDVDLVIKNQDHMDLFIKFLMYELKSLDGKRNSAANLLELIHKRGNAKDIDP